MSESDTDSKAGTEAEGEVTPVSAEVTVMANEIAKLRETVNKLVILLKERL